MGFGGWIGGLIIPLKSRGVEVNRIHGDWPGAAGSGGWCHPPGEPEQRRSAGALEGDPSSGPESGANPLQVTEFVTAAVCYIYTA